MTKFVRLLLGSLGFVIVAITIIVIRNYQMDSGVRALKEGNDIAAMKTFKLLAEFGDQKAQYLLGSMYAYGWGAPKSDSDAIYWFARSAMWAEDGVDPAAPAELGVAKSYAEGTNGVKVDSAESLKWLRFAAAGGSKDAAAMLAKSQAR